MCMHLSVCVYDSVHNNMCICIYIDVCVSLCGCVGAFVCCCVLGVFRHCEVVNLCVCMLV